MPKITLRAPAREERDQVLGRYMDSFARLERMIQITIQMLLDLDPIKARPIFATLMTKQSVELLEAAAKTMLKAKDAKRITDLCARIGKRNMRRNHIVHGYWTIHITPTDQGQTEEWIRVYDNVDPALALGPHDPKLLGVYTFTIPALSKATDHVEEMVQALSDLMPDIPKLLAQRLTPEEKLRNWASGQLAANAAITLRLGKYQIR